MINVFHYHACLEIDAHLEWLIELELCDIPVQSLIGLIEYSCQQVATSFPEAGLQRTPTLSVLGPEKFGMVDRPGSSSRVRTSEDKVCRKDCVGL